MKEVNANDLIAGVVNTFTLKVETVSYTHLDVYKRQDNDLVQLVVIAELDGQHSIFP